MNSSSNYINAPMQEALKQTPPPGTLRIQPRFRRSGNMLLDLSIGQRLTLGFLLAALIATLVASLVGVLRSQALSRQSDFYQHLLATNTSLTSGANFLQLMNTEVHTYLDTAGTTAPSQETLTQQRNAIQDLAGRYDTILHTYVTQDLLSQNPDQVALLDEAGNSGQVSQQQTLVGSALRTWSVYRAAQNQILQDTAAKDLQSAQTLARSQAEPTSADAISAVRALIQLNQRLATSVRVAASVEEQNQLVTTIIGAILAFLAIILVGWFISNTLVKRLKHLRKVTQAVEQGHWQERVPVIGRDEIASVSASVNAMLDAIVSLLQETSKQRDALTNAAEHLFSDMRVVSAGDLRINAPVTDDPIGMLANAFNFTVSRFRRFVLRVQTTIEQIDVISRQELERAEHFALALAQQQGQVANKGIISQQRSESGEVGSVQENAAMEQTALLELATLLRQSRERLQKILVDGIYQRTPTVQTLSEQITRVIKEAAWQQGTMNDGLVRLPMRDMQIVEQLFQRMMAELRSAQQSTAKNLIELDRELMNLSQSVQKGKASLPALSSSTSLAIKEQADLARLSVGFASEVGTLARKLSALSQEMRAGIIAFQLDMPEQANNPASHPGTATKGTANYSSPTSTLTSEQRNTLSPRPYHTTHPLS